jgi:hypothetical protein
VRDGDVCAAGRLVGVKPRRGCMAAPESIRDGAVDGASGK